MRNDQRPNVVLIPLMYKTPWEEKEIRIFWSVINSMQRLILYLHRNDDVLNKWQLLD